MSKAFYLTTPLYYVNDVPHVGHTYTTVIGDAIARYKRLCGLDVCYLTGTDEHGLKLERAAREKKVTPAQLTDSNAAEFERVWGRLRIDFDEFIRTTQPRHHETVRDIFGKIDKNGYIYLGEYSGQYCVRCEAYVAEGETECPICRRPTEFIREESYFFKLSAFQDRLLNFYRDNPDFVIPQTRMNEIVSFVMSGLKDVSISRTSFSWGIPMPDNPQHIFYVWFDALHGYLSGIGYGVDPDRFKKLWPAGVQLMGKDILRFHGVYWPAFLMAAGLEPPQQLLVHGWWTINGEKMSKSAGNFVTADALLGAIAPDCIKYFLLREISLGADGDFSFDALVTRINSDLANDLGNLASRILKMIDSYFDGTVPASSGLEGADEHLVRFSQETVQLYRENFDKFQLNKALANVWELISLGNKYIVANEPWKLARKPTARDRLGTVLYNAAESLRIISILLSPIIPDGTSSVLRQLGIAKPVAEHRLSDLGWGGLESGTKTGKVQAVYPRLKKREFLAAVRGTPPSRAQAEKESGSPPQEEEEKIGIEEFARVQMRVGKILQAERVPKSDKLVKLRVDVGSEVRQIVAGIGQAYEPEALEGRLVAVVTNLKPARLMGLKSDGMIVAASHQGKPVLATFSEPVEIGALLS